MEYPHRSTESICNTVRSRSQPAPAPVLVFPRTPANDVPSTFKSGCIRLREGELLFEICNDVEQRLPYTFAQDLWLICVEVDMWRAERAFFEVGGPNDTGANVLRYARPSGSIELTLYSDLNCTGQILFRGPLAQYSETIKTNIPFKTVYWNSVAEDKVEYWIYIR